MTAGRLRGPCRWETPEFIQVRPASRSGR